MNNSVISYEDRISYTEIYDIIMFLNDDEKNKIPKKFIEFVQKNRLKDYITKVNPYVPLEFQKVRKKTRNVIAYIYRRYLADESEKEEFREQEKKEYEEEQRILKEKKDKEQSIVNLNSEKEEPIEISNLPVVKESMFIKIKNFIKKILKK